MTKTLGIMGLGAFGQLMVKHLGPHFTILAHDPSPEVAAFASAHGVKLTTSTEVAGCNYIVLATPVPRMAEAVAAIKDHLKPGALVLDVGSVKVKPAELLRRELPENVDIICTHPLFGPQSAKEGVKGLKIVICPIRSSRTEKLVSILRDQLELEVIVTTPEEHDREVAVVQGLTHLIAKVLVDMEPLPHRLTTKSFELLMQGVEMVRHDSMELFLAIERDNPYSAELRHRFFSKADELRCFLEAQEHDRT